MLNKFLIFLALIYVCFYIFVEKAVKIYSVSSNSMFPTLEINTIVVTQPQNEYQAGDIITYKNENQKLITHRILRIDINRVNNQKMYITKGDNNSFPDPNPQPTDVIIGKVIVVSKLSGHVYNFLFIKKYWLLPAYAILGYLAGKILKRRTYTNNQIF